MRKRITKMLAVVITFAFMIAGLPAIRVDAAQGVIINAANFPDDSFRRTVSIVVDKDKDGYLSNEEIAQITKSFMLFGFNSPKYTTIKGIEYFTYLDSLNISNAGISSLDVSTLVNLKELFCSGNQLTSLDLSNNTNLIYLDVSYNPLTTLIVDTSELRSLNYSGVTGISIDLNNCPNLTSLGCASLGLNELDVSRYPDLDYLNCAENNLTTLDISNNPKLFEVNCCNNQLTALDAGNCPDLNYVNCRGNDLSYLVLNTNSICYNRYDTYESVYGYSYDETIDDYVEDQSIFYGDIEGGYVIVDSDVTVLTESDPRPVITSVPTPEPTDAPMSAPSTTAPTTAPATTAPTTAPVTSSGTGANGFVERLYTIALGRSSDPAGQEAWVNTITSGENTGADVARGFLYSSEFLNKDVSNVVFVQTLYLTFFNREADEGGLNAWVGVLDNGTSKEEVIEGFINSTEWSNVCVSYGIPSGGTGTPSVDVEPNQGTIDFCTRLYTTCLSRSADENGLMAWARQLANQRDTGTGAARGFFFSSEFLGQNTDNGEYVTRLYRTFMGREPDQAGFDAWVAQLDQGVSREEVFDGFAQSVEFGRICISYGIMR